MNVRLALKSILNKKIVNCAIDDEKIIRWGESTEQPTEKEINDKIAELQAEYEANQYQRDRSTEYPELPEQLDMLFHAIDAGALDKTSAFYTTLKAVKDKYPKG